jgi:general secretion pathway protein G
LKNAGFTFLELLVTMTIIGILASVAMPLSKVTSLRRSEIELRQHLRSFRAAIDAFKLDWNREGDVLLGPLCLKNRLTCKEVSGVYGYPKSLKVLLEIELSGEEATVRGTPIKRYLRHIPKDPFTEKGAWALRCYSDPPNTINWCGEDVYDVSSKSQEQALDGTTYRDW